MHITAIAAVARNGVIGTGDTIPWHLPDDWKRFKAVTVGGQLLMGRRTFESIGRPLPGRRSLVLTRGGRTAGLLEQVLPGETSVLFVRSLHEALLAAAERPEQRLWVAGGAEIYRLAWDVTTNLDITEVHQEPSGSAVFPRIADDQWRRTGRDPRDGFTFVTYARAPIEPTLTERLVLEPLADVHARDLHAFETHQAPGAMHHAAHTAAERLVWLTERRADWHRDGLGCWMAYTRDTHELVGVGGLRRVHQSSAQSGAESWTVCCWLLPEAHGHGFSDEVRRAAAAQVAG